MYKCLFVSFSLRHILCQFLFHICVLCTADFRVECQEQGPKFRINKLKCKENKMKRNSSNRDKINEMNSRPKIWYKSRRSWKKENTNVWSRDADGYGSSSTYKRLIINKSFSKLENILSFCVHIVCGLFLFLACFSDQHHHHLLLFFNNLFKAKIAEQKWKKA